MNVVEVKDVSKTYDLGRTKVNALRGISLEIARGEFVTIAGPSGSGKSTLLNIIGCIDRPDNGEVLIDGTEVSGLGEPALDGIRLHTIGFIFQSFNLIPVLNVFENIELPLLIRKDIGREERRKRVERFREEVGLREQRRQKPSELSGGQRQRVAIARALVGAPAIVLADEPTANLDSRTGLEVIECMQAINRREGATFIFSSHDPKIVECAHRVFRLEDGVKTGEERR
jgi:putative ABC transport system ATP-binding protein